MDIKFNADDLVENRHGNTDVHNVPENIKQKQATRLKNNLKLM